LRAWYGSLRPAPLVFRADETPLEMARSYEWRACAFPETDDGASFSRGVDVVGVFGFPAHSGAPFLSGYAARFALNDALAAATREAMQHLAFLWGEPAVEAAPEPAPTPAFHLDLLQWTGRRDRIRRWLAGAHVHYGATRARPPASFEIDYVDITPPWLGGGLCVAKALCPAASPLAFGDTPFADHLPPELRVHPIA
jgi:hypothetical protein